MSADTVERGEDMSPDGRLQIHKQPDGDVIVTVHGKGYGNHDSMASVEFCSPGSGGGKSPHTIEALRKLFEAMMMDNDGKPAERRPISRADFEGKP